MPTSADYDITATDEQSPANASHRAQKVYILLAGELITSLTAGMPVEPPIIRRAYKGDAPPRDPSDDLAKCSSSVSALHSNPLSSELGLSLSLSSVRVSLLSLTTYSPLEGY